MPARVGPTEAERQQIISQLKAGASFDAVRQAWAPVVEGQWFERNEEHLAEVVRTGKDPKPSPVSVVPHQSGPTVGTPSAAAEAKAPRSRRGRG